MGRQCGSAAHQKGGVYHLAPVIHLFHHGDGGNRAYDSHEKARHAVSVHAGFLARPVQGLFQKPPQDFRHRKASQHYHADGRHHGHRLLNGGEPFEETEAGHIFHRPCGQPDGRQKPDACRKISEAFDRLIREKADSGHEHQGEQKNRQALE